MGTWRTLPLTPPALPSPAFTQHFPSRHSHPQPFTPTLRTMSCQRDIRFELLSRLCPNSTGADIRSVCTEAGMYAIRARRKTVTEKDFLDAVTKVIKGYSKFSATPKYMVYN